MDVDKLLRDLRMPPHLNGYWQFKRVCELCLENERLLLNITKLLYTKVADEFETTPRCVEINIRRAIAVVWKSGNRKLLEQIMGTPLSAPPSSAKLFAQLYYYLKS